MNTELRIKKLNAILNAEKFLESDAPDWKKDGIKATLASLSRMGVNTDKDASRVLADNSVWQQTRSHIDVCLVNLINDIY